MVGGNRQALIIYLCGLPSYGISSGHSSSDGGLKNTSLDPALLLLLCKTCTINFAVKVVVDYYHMQRKWKVQDTTAAAMNFYCLQYVHTYYVAAILPKLASEPRTENDLKKIKSPYMDALMLVRKCKVC